MPTSHFVFAKLTSRFSCLAAVAIAMLHMQGVAAADFHKDIIYQVFTDRFFNGRTDNDNPPQSPGLFDASRKNWKAYWGGDLAGVKEKLGYIKSLGCTAIWISPCIDNINKPDNDAAGNMVAPYHGYHARDFMRVDEHFGDSDMSFKDFDALTKAAHDLNMRVFVDMPFNHTSPYNHAEYGALYDSGQFRSDVENDRNKYFHHLPAVSDFNDPFQLQYGTIFYLGDLDQENQYVDTYLKQAAAKFQSHGADGTRLDAAKHMNWGWQHVLANGLYNRADHLVLGEWWLTGVDDPMYKDAVKFANKGGVSLYDFPLAYAIRKAFVEGGDLNLVDQVVKQENQDFIDPNELLTFIDNHDMSRFPNLTKDKKAMQLALATLLTSRGIPIIYYGTEQGLYDDTKGGEDPYDRPMMQSFDQSSENYKLIQKLTALRRSNQALNSGKQKTIFCSKDLYIFERRAGSQVAIVALSLSKNDSTVSADVAKSLGSAANVSIADVSIADALSGALSGVSLSSNLTMPPQSLSVWLSSSEPASTAFIAAVRPPAASAGKPVTIYGTGFGSGGKVTLAGEEMTISSWSDDKIVFNAPLLKRGRLPLAVSAGASKAEGEMVVVENKLALVRFVVSGVKLGPGEQLYISGSTSALGSGSFMPNEAAGPMLLNQDSDEKNYILAVPMPGGQSVDLQLFVCNAKGEKLRTETKAHAIKMPQLGPSVVNLNWQ